jgi:hypothetical protein
LFLPEAEALGVAASCFITFKPQSSALAALDPVSLHAEDARSLRANRIGRIDFSIFSFFVLFSAGWREKLLDKAAPHPHKPGAWRGLPLRFADQKSRTTP